ncbi:MAG TPA: LysR substrate-binding domain-containing protein [Bosea sp. (in: a-proteobacteria)]
MSLRNLRLPPLNALRVFHAVIRHGSFRSAADELFVTPQAVSQQIKLLEDSLSVVLFDRKGRVIEPTEPAILLAHYIQAGFEEFSEGVRRVTKGSYRNRINLNASPYFATRYLMDRIEHFRDRLPGADLRLTTMIELPDFARDDVDVAIQWGFGQWKDYEATLLVLDPKVPCCSPSLAARISSPADLMGMTLLHPVLANTLWRRVLAHLGVQAPELANEIQFQDAATMRRATLSGLGVGLISILDAAEDLQSGRLVAPFGLDALKDMAEADIPGFYMILPRAHRRVKSVTTFCDWANAEDWSEPLRAVLAP